MENNDLEKDLQHLSQKRAPRSQYEKPVGNMKKQFTKKK